VVVVKRALGLLAAAALVGALAGCGTGGGTITVDAIFKQLGDLPRFAMVQAADVTIGSVRAIKLDGYNARVTLRIKKDADIPRDALALIRSTSLLGEEFVELRAPATEAAQADVLRNGDVIPLSRTARIPGLDDALISLGRLMEGGTTADLATMLHSSAQILQGKGQELGQIFSELRQILPVLSGRAPDLATAIDNLNDALAVGAANSGVLARAIASGANATGLLAQQQANLHRLVSSLDKASSVLARYTKATAPSTDRSIKDLTGVLDKVMMATGDLDKTLSSLAQFTDLWPRVFPGDYLQLDVVFSLTDTVPPPASSASIARAPQQQQQTQVLPVEVPSLANLLWGAMR
jgi:phospholipid/cholesterol/gamma-HCH transport system substrate-binding protein